MRPLWLMTAALAAGCAGTPKTAIVDGREVPRLSLEFTGNAYSVKHEGAHPRPGSPSSGLSDRGGSIRGRVCGMFADFEVTHKGDHVQVVGAFDSHIDAAIDVTEKDGMRHFTGNLGTLGVDFLATPSTMQGHVGIRVFAADTTGDVYHGFMRIPGLLNVNNSQGRIPMTVSGRDAMWAMPAADQALLLPSILTCGSMQFRIVDAIDVGFGGPATDRPPETSAVYTNM